jgi:hypothetical protein
MDVEIRTSDPGDVDPADVAKALEVKGFYVHSVVVFDRKGNDCGSWVDVWGGA